MEGSCESDCGGDEVYPATFSDEEKTELKLDNDDESLAWTTLVVCNATFYCSIKAFWEPLSEVHKR